jgi:hypothetical protein
MACSSLTDMPAGARWRGGGKVVVGEMLIDDGERGGMDAVVPHRRWP